MKSILSKIATDSNSSFVYKNIVKDNIIDPWHFHKEYELVLMDKGKGTKFIGDNVSNFEEGNLTLIGSNIPHLFRNHEDHYEKTKSRQVRVIYTLFSKDFLGSEFFNISEMQSVNKLLEKSSLALEVGGHTKKWIIKKLYAMNDQKPALKLISLLEILIHLSTSKELKSLLAIGYVTNNNNGDTNKINAIFDYILQNYTEEIYVDKIASELNMSATAFSRYFKQHTRKTFTDYVTEIRIGHACRMLMEDNCSISEISYHSGFDNLSNFYRHFKRVIGMIPKEYKNRFINLQV
jgi:AraC-like DNA-binding protein